MAPSRDDREAQIRAKQLSDAALCAELVGLSDTTASALVRQRGYVVRVAAIGSRTLALTADLRGDRVNLFLSDDRVVVRADVG